MQVEKNGNDLRTLMIKWDQVMVQHKNVPDLAIPRSDLYHKIEHCASVKDVVS